MNDDKRAEIVARSFSSLDLIGDPDLRRGVIDCWVRVWRESSWERLEDCPVNPNIPDMPLVDHVNCLAEMALASAKALEKYRPGLTLDRDHLITGILLHDLSKLVEIAPGGDGPVFSGLNRRLPHSVYGACVAMQQGFDTKIANMILSHTRLTGAKPDSPEAVLLHYLDYGMADVLRSADGLPLILEGGSTFGVK